MTRKTAALAVFVKTPGFSPVKTRLAKTLNPERAVEFYGLSVAAVEQTLLSVKATTTFTAYWAVAEKSAMNDPRWATLPCVWQGDGSLGDRLHRVVAELLCHHSAVVVIGADSPQISPELLREAIDAVATTPFESSYVLGRCPDGGFYLFGTNRPVHASVWAAIPLGKSGAATALVRHLDACGRRHELPARTDVDRAEDLVLLCRELREFDSLTPPQQAILNWATEWL